MIWSLTRVCRRNSEQLRADEKVIFFLRDRSHLHLTSSITSGRTDVMLGAASDGARDELEYMVGADGGREVSGTSRAGRHLPPLSLSIYHTASYTATSSALECVFPDLLCMRARNDSLIECEADISRLACTDQGFASPPWIATGIPIPAHSETCLRKGLIASL